MSDYKKLRVREGDKALVQIHCKKGTTCSFTTYTLKLDFTKELASVFDSIDTDNTWAVSISELYSAFTEGTLTPEQIAAVATATEYYKESPTICSICGDSDNGVIELPLQISEPDSVPGITLHDIQRFESRNLKKGSDKKELKAYVKEYEDNLRLVKAIQHYVARQPELSFYGLSPFRLSQSSWGDCYFLAALVSYIHISNRRRLVHNKNYNIDVDPNTYRVVTDGSDVTIPHLSLGEAMTLAKEWNQSWSSPKYHSAYPAIFEKAYGQWLIDHPKFDNKSDLAWRALLERPDNSTCKAMEYVMEFLTGSSKVGAYLLALEPAKMPPSLPTEIQNIDFNSLETRPSDDNSKGVEYIYKYEKSLDEIKNKVPKTVKNQDDLIRYLGHRLRHHLSERNILIGAINHKKPELDDLPKVNGDLHDVEYGFRGTRINPRTGRRYRHAAHHAYSIVSIDWETADLKSSEVEFFNPHGKRDKITFKKMIEIFDVIFFEDRSSS